jgi:MFS family permease
MIGSIALVVIGFLIAQFAVRDSRALQRIAPADESTGQVLTAGLRLSMRQPKIFMGFLVRLINTAPQYGMFIVLPAVIGTELGWGQTRWLTMSVFVYATNILVNAVFGAVGDRWGWRWTVQWFGVFGSAVGLLLWWYVPHLVPAGSTWGFWVSVAAGCVFGCLLAGFVPMGAIMPALAPDHKGAAMAMYTTAAGGAQFLGAAVVAVVLAVGLGNAGVVWAFVLLYGAAFVMVAFLDVSRVREVEHAH